MHAFMSVSGWALILGGLLAGSGWVLFALLDPEHTHHEHPRWLPLNGLIIGGGVGMALGTPGLYLHHSTEVGWLGLLGNIILFVGIVVPYLVVHAIETATSPAVPPMMGRFVAIGAPSLFAGLLLTAIAILLGGVYPTGLGVLFFASTIAGLLTIIQGIPAWLGRNLAPLPYCLAMVWARMVLLG